MSLTWSTAADWDNYQSQSHITHEAIGDNTDSKLQIGNDPSHPNLIGYWSLDETSGDALDSSGNGNHGTVNGATQGATGTFGTTCYDFGTGNNTVTVPNAPELSITGSMTVMCWINAPSGTEAATDESWWVTKGDELWGLKREGDDAVTAWTTTDGSGTNFLKGSTYLGGDGWLHATMTYDTSNMILYENASQAGSVAQSGNLNTDSNPLTFGGDYVNSTNYHPGKLDQILLFNDALTQPEIAKYAGLTGNYVSGVQTL